MTSLKYWDNDIIYSTTQLYTNHHTYNSSKLIARARAVKGIQAKAIIKNQCQTALEMGLPNKGEVKEDKRMEVNNNTE